MDNFDQLVGELGAALDAPDLPRLLRSEPGADRKWRAGDIAARFPSNRLQEVATRLDVPLSQLRSYAEVARSYPVRDRTVRAAWTVYRELKDTPEGERQRILRDGLTLRDARVAIGKGPMDQPKFSRLSVSTQAERIIQGLANPDVFSIVRDFIQTADRETKRNARSVLEPIERMKKAFDAEARKQQREPTIHRQYIESSKRIVDAARFAYSIARLHARNPEAMSDEQWKQLAEHLRDFGESAQDVADRLEGKVSEEGIEYVDTDEVLELTSTSSDLTVLDDEVVEAEIIDD